MTGVLRTSTKRSKAEFLAWLRGVEQDFIATGKEDADLLALSKAILASEPIKKGTSGVLAAIRLEDGNDLVVYQSSSGTVTTINGKTGFKRALLSAWLGKPSDDQLRRLREDILSSRP
jgi:hypothetical protein